MNTKQVLYDALKAQLEIKKQESEKYEIEVYTPAINNLKDKISNYIYTIVDGVDRIECSDYLSYIKLYSEGSKYKCIELSVGSNYNPENTTRHINFNFNGGDFKVTEQIQDNDFKYLQLLTNISSNINTISDKFLNEWYPLSKELRVDLDKALSEYKTLDNALNKLKNEIKNDVYESMKEIGFEIKKFKESTSLDYNYKDNNEREYKIVSRSKAISIQYGRAQYESTYVEGFKILGKKGNKYEVEVYKENVGSRIYNVLEKKFESFLEEVNDWETVKADKEKEMINERYQKYSND